MMDLLKKHIYLTLGLAVLTYTSTSIALVGQFPPRSYSAAKIYQELFESWKSKFAAAVNGKILESTTDSITALEDSTICANETLLIQRTEITRGTTIKVNFYFYCDQKLVGSVDFITSGNPHKLTLNEFLGGLWYDINTLSQLEIDLNNGSNNKFTYSRKGNEKRLDIDWTIPSAIDTRYFLVFTEFQTKLDAHRTYTSRMTSSGVEFLRQNYSILSNKDSFGLYTIHIFSEQTRINEEQFYQIFILDLKNRLSHL